MRLEQDMPPFPGEVLVLSKAEMAVLNKAADIAEKAAAFYEPESDLWYEWKRLEHAARYEGQA